MVPGSLTFSQLVGLPAWLWDVHLTGDLDCCKVLISHNVKSNLNKKSIVIKSLSLETACPPSQGSAESDELCFLFVWERFPWFTHKGSLDRNVQWALCQKTWCLKFDRCLLVFYPRSLNMHTKLEETMANNATFQVDSIVIFARKFTDSISNIKLSALKENKA